MDLKSAVALLVEGKNLEQQQMRDVMQQIMTGKATDAQIGALLVALRMKGETVDEITAAAGVMRELVTAVEISGKNIVDIVGTGGDGLKTFNISTTCCFVVAAAGATVAKHGNRSVSSTSGSADLLEAAGVNLNLSHQQVGQCIDKIQLGFMFAPLHHSAMKYTIGPRKELSIRTIFNLLGPLTNPAGVSNQLLGVFSAEWLEPLALALKNLGSNHVMVVHSDDGLDEISISATTQVCELKQGKIQRYQINPQQFGLNSSPLDELIVNSAEQSLDMVKSVLDNQPGAARDIVSLNSGAAIYCAGISDSLEQGIEKAQQIIADGLAKQKLQQLIEISNSFK
ncbi:MAG: anthranilate phosphoribosyltransferase [Pseudomonadota bacterium]